MDVQKRILNTKVPWVETFDPLLPRVKNSTLYNFVYNIFVYNIFVYNIFVYNNFLFFIFKYINIFIFLIKFVYLRI